MNIVINGDLRAVADGSTVAEVVAGLGMGRQQGVAVARNGDVVLRSQWDSVRLEPDDRVEVLHAVQGG